MKRLKDEMKSLQKEMRNTKDPQEISKLNKKLLKLNSEYMHHSLKVNLYTFLPIILIFGWLANIFSGFPFEPNTTINLELTLKSLDENISLVLPNQLELVNETKTGSKVFYTILSKQEGSYDIKILPCNSSIKLISSTKLTNKTKAMQTINDACIKSAFIRYRPLKFNILGIKMGWFWAYLLFSLFLSSIIRKMFKVY